MSAFEFHGRMQSFVMLGFSGFGLAALPLGVFADSTSVGTALVAMGAAIMAMTVAFATVGLRLRRAAQMLDVG